MIHLLRQPATAQQVKEMLEVHETYIKVAVDIHRDLLAGGGEFHADCGSVLVVVSSTAGIRRLVERVTGSSRLEPPTDQRHHFLR